MNETTAKLTHNEEIKTACPSLAGTIAPTLADAGNGETVIHAELSLDELLAYRRDLPFLADMK